MDAGEMVIPMPLPAKYPEEGTSGIDYTADQMLAYAEAYGDARAAEERERCAAILLANAQACTGLTREILLANVAAIRCLEASL